MISWNKGIFENTINLTEDGEYIGFLKSDPWSNSAIGKLNNKNYTFSAKGIFRKVVLILDQESNETVGNIHFNEFSSKAKINFKSSENAMLYMRNFWQTKWRLSSESTYRVDYQGGLTSGQIEASDSAPEALILAGLFATNRIWEYSTLIVIAVAIILAT